MTRNGKGSRIRPRQISYEEYSRKWDTIFGDRSPKTETSNVKEQVCPSQSDGISSQSAGSSTQARLTTAFSLFGDCPEAERPPSSEGAQGVFMWMRTPEAEVDT